MIVNKVRQRPQYRNLWQTYNLMIVIDEISMLSAQMFDMLDAAAKELRSDWLMPFGGIKLILCGDFMQLQPIKGNLLCTSLLFQNYFNSRNTLKLTKKYRHNGAELLLPVPEYQN